MQIFVVDAFTDRAFSGNPAGVVPLAAPADPDWMQRVAAEMRHAETAFARPIESPDAEWELRWFTPRVEVALCGHATLGTAHALYEQGLAPADRPLRFQTLRSGVLTVGRTPEGLLEMDFPANPGAPAEVPDGLSEALGGVPVPGVLRSAQNDLLVRLPDEETVRKLAPDLRALSRLDARGICVTAPGSAPYDFVSRFFAPSVGVDEDPVTGSAHCMLTPYWAKELGRTELTAYQASERGGQVRVALQGDRVRLRGTAVTVLTGTLTPAAGQP